ncbi:MAG: DUF1731 domain-containing protein [Myxococcales bacterium]|nr:DUF1731 domain-containing protein [Myxococcales bacterium]
MRIVIPGGSGQLGQVMVRGLTERGHDVAVIGRHTDDPALRWDGHSDGPWFAAIDGADAVVNLAGRSVSCRYHWRNLNEMMQSRIDSATAVGRAIAAARTPPPVWLQASTASIYAHTHGPAHDEQHGILGGTEPDVPAYWGYSVSIARAWEMCLHQADTPQTRKVAMRLGFTMSPDPGGVFDWLMWMVRRGLGGPFYGGDQFVSWLHGDDLVRAVLFLLETPEIEGPVNLTAPTPLANRDFMQTLRKHAGAPLGLPVLPGMAEIGAWLIDTDVELLRKSRRVVPGRLTTAGFQFSHPTWGSAARDLVRSWATFPV